MLPSDELFSLVGSLTNWVNPRCDIWLKTTSWIPSITEYSLSQSILDKLKSPTTTVVKLVLSESFSMSCDNDWVCLTRSTRFLKQECGGLYMTIKRYVVALSWASIQIYSQKFKSPDIEESLRQHLIEFEIKAHKPPPERSSLSRRKTWKRFSGSNIESVMSLLSHDSVKKMSFMSEP